MQKFIKREVLLEATSVQKLMKIDLKEKKYHYKEVKIGIATSSMLKKVKVSDGKKTEFRKDCISYLVAVVSKLKERGPLKYRIVHVLSSPSPQIIYSSPNLGRKRFEELLTCLNEQKWVNASKADTATSQYDELCRIAKTLYEKEFKEFDMCKSR